MGDRAKPLRAGQVLYNDDGIGYEVGAVIGEGGFGQAYSAFRLSADGSRPVAQVCLKVCGSADDWHGEAFFGKVVRGYDRAVQMLDSFVASTGRGRLQVRRHVLVFEYMTEGTVYDAVKAERPPWDETRVRKEIGGVLELLSRMHNVGITHRDLTPANVFLRGGHLVLGDFGITRMTLDPRRAEVTAFTPAYTPKVVWASHRWGPAEDVFQLGLLACTLLSGQVWQAEQVNTIRQLDVSEDLKCWIWHATAANAKKYLDATDAKDALTTLRHFSLQPGRAPASIAGQRVVFTGKLENLTRADAVRLVTNAGAQVQSSVSDTTTLVVRGPVRNALSEFEGRKLFAVRERLRLGQPIKVISGRQLERLLRIKASR
ncbi:protein kinase [Antrihabitans sp. YC2-6]|uniref:protein kinase domain-containing protein n=1 Tax=Antrihabitans sp. YC2-6 TaxID=2799498 RepID=UPI0018F41BF0|nr:protein kinase [Antrihabitans sp. YC2-6]MBJ8348057.1 protein kinase [Antrihabitans sp. YC2-6]